MDFSLGDHPHKEMSQREEFSLSDVGRASVQRGDLEWDNRAHGE